MLLTLTHMFVFIVRIPSYLTISITTEVPYVHIDHRPIGPALGLHPRIHAPTAPKEQGKGPEGPTIPYYTNPLFLLLHSTLQFEYNSLGDSIKLSPFEPSGFVVGLQSLTLHLCEGVPRVPHARDTYGIHIPVREDTTSTGWNEIPHKDLLASTKNQWISLIDGILSTFLTTLTTMFQYYHYTIQ